MIRSTTAPPAFFHVTLTLVVLICACGPGTDQPGPATSPIDLATIQSDDPGIIAAVSEANRLVKDSPADPKSWFNLGRTLQANGLFAEAEFAYTRLTELQPNHPQARYLKAVAQYQQQKLQEAAAALGALSDTGTTDAAMERSLATWSLELGDPVRAEAAAQRSIELEPNSRGGHALLARCYVESGRPALAITVLEPLIKNTIRHRYLDFLFATALMAQGREADARELMPETPPAPPRWPDPHLDAMNEFAAGYPAAISETKEWLLAGELDRALPRAEELHEKNPDSVAAAILYALCLRDSGRFSAAMTVLSHELDKRPRHPELLYQAAAVLVMAAQNSGDGSHLPTALSLAESSIEVDPGAYQGYGVAGGVLLSMGRLDEAATAFQRCAEIDPLSPAQCPTKAGNVLIMAGHVEEGLALLREAVDQQPLEAAPNVTYAVQLKTLGRQSELEALLDRLRGGGSVTADLLVLVEKNLASGKGIEPPKLSSGGSH